MFIMILFSLIWFWVQLWNCCFAFVTFKFRVFGLLACGFCNFGLGDIFCCCTLFCSSFLSWDLQKGQSDPQLHFSTDCSLVLGFSSSCYTHTDCVYATDHRINLKNWYLDTLASRNHDKESFLLLEFLSVAFSLLVIMLQTNSFLCFCLLPQVWK